MYEASLKDTDVCKPIFLYSLLVGANLDCSSLNLVTSAAAAAAAAVAASKLGGRYRF